MPTPKQSRGMVLDKGYDDKVRELLAEFGSADHMGGGGGAKSLRKKPASRHDGAS